MRYILPNSRKTVNIPDSEIERNKTLLGLSTEEAIQMWIEDNGYVDNEEVNRLTEKAREVKLYVSTEKKGVSRKREKKVNVDKQTLIDVIRTAIADTVNITEVKSETEISFVFNEKSFTIKLIEHRPPKKK